MDMSSIPGGEIAAKNADPSPINDAIQKRGEALAGQMNPEAAAQFISDMKSLQCTVSGNGSSMIFSVTPTDSYLIKYLEKHNVPVAGGDNGTAYNVDGTTYHSLVDPDLWGTQLPWLELPHIDGEEEAQQILAIMAQDCAYDAVSKSSAEYEEAVPPLMSQEVSQTLGGGAQ